MGRSERWGVRWSDFYQLRVGFSRNFKKIRKDETTMKFKRMLTLICMGCMLLFLMGGTSAAEMSNATDLTEVSVTELAYMDLESAPAEIRADILAAREKIIFGDQAWTVNGAVSIFGRDGTIQELPEFSELYPDWELPGAAATSSVPASAMPMGTYSGEINYEEQVNFQLASSWANSKDFTQFVGNGDYVYVYAKSMPRNANFNIGFSNGAGVNIGWCPNLDKETGARIDSDSNKTYNVRGSAANEASVSVYRMVITSDEKDAMSWLDPMYP